LAQCATKVLLPTGDIVIEDGPRTVGVENYKEFFYALVGFNGEGQNFDGNGQWIRAGIGGSQRVETGPTPLTGLKLYGNAQQTPRGTRPAMPTKLPTQKFTEDCKDQTRPDLNAAVTGPADGQNTRPGRLLGYGPETAKTLPSKSKLRSSTPRSASRTVGAPEPQAAPEKVARVGTGTGDDSVSTGLLGVLNPLRGGKGDE
ncbi:MAG: hypothetical protein ACEQSX_02330, partial [Baekduiaceae bacterium]